MWESNADGGVGFEALKGSFSYMRYIGVYQYDNGLLIEVIYGRSCCVPGKISQVGYCE